MVPLFLYMRWKSAVFTLVTLLPSAASANGFYFISDHFVRSDSFSVPVMLDEFKGRYQSGERLYASSWNELGYRYKAIGFGLVARGEYGGHFSEDTSVFAGKLINKADLEPGKTYSLDFEAFGFVASGVRASYRLERSKLMLEAGIALLKASYLMDATINGNATAIAENDYDFEADFNYYAYTDPVFEWDVESPIAKGWTLDLAGSYDFNDTWAVDFWARDVFGFLYWESAPYTKATGRSGNKTYDENGYVEWNPAFSGIQKYRDYGQRLKPSANIEIAYRINAGVSVFAGSRYHFEEYIPSTAGKFDTAIGTFKATFYPTTQAAGLEWYGGGLLLGIQADNININEMTHIGLKLAVNY